MSARRSPGLTVSSLTSCAGHSPKREPIHAISPSVHRAVHVGGYSASDAHTTKSANDTFSSKSAPCLCVRACVDRQGAGRQVLRDSLPHSRGWASPKAAEPTRRWGPREGCGRLLAEPLPQRRPVPSLRPPTAVLATPAVGLTSPGSTFSEPREGRLTRRLGASAQRSCTYRSSPHGPQAAVPPREGLGWAASAQVPT